MEQNKKKGKGPIKAFSQPCTTGPDKAHVDATKTNPIMEPMILGEVPLTGVDATCSRPLGNAGVDQHTRTPQLTLPTGSGKSLCYAIFAFDDMYSHVGSIALIMSPLKALMKDQVSPLVATLMVI